MEEREGGSAKKTLRTGAKWRRMEDKDCEERKEEVAKAQKKRKKKYGQQEKRRQTVECLMFLFCFNPPTASQ